MGRSRWRELVGNGHFSSRGGLFGLTALAFALRLWQLDSQSLWFDEAYSVFVARLPLAFSFEVLIADGVHPPLYYLMQRLALVFGESEAAVRLPSVIFGALAVPLTYRLGCTWGSAKQAILWSALVALSPFHIWYSREARMYALLMTLALASMAAYWGFLQRPTWRRATWLALASLLAYLTHYFALFLPLVQLVHLILHLRRYPHHLRLWVPAQFAASLPLIVWVITIARQPGLTFGIGWIEQPTPIDLVYTYLNMSVGLVRPLDAVSWMSLAVLGLLAWIGAKKGWGQQPAGSLLVIWAAVPVLLTFLMSLRRPVYVDRFLIICLPAMLLLVSRGSLSLAG